MRLSDLLNEMDRASSSSARAKPLPEAACATLREVASRYARTLPFKPGDLVTPCAAGDVKQAGEPHIVLEARDRPAPDFTAKGAEETVSNAYGRRCDLRVASVVGGDVVPFWVESWQFEPYRGPGSEAPAARSTTGPPPYAARFRPPARAPAVILSPFDLALLAPVAALLQPHPQEPAVALPNDFARRLAGLGFYGPFRVRAADPVIEDRAGHPLTLVLPVIDGPGDRREIAAISCIAINTLCGFAPPEPDTVELAAIAIRQQAALPHASAAE